MIAKIEIQNYKCFSRATFPFVEGMNLIVGRNESGKSTLLEAVSCCLTGRLPARRGGVVTQGMFNAEVVASFLAGLTKIEDKSGVQVRALPAITMDLFVREIPETKDWRGSNNLTEEDAIGLRFRICFDEEYVEVLPSILNEAEATGTFPVEFYRTEWRTFQNNPVIARSLPIRATKIDATRIRLESGSDYYIRSIVDGRLHAEDRLDLLAKHRQSKESFAASAPVSRINLVLAETSQGVTEKALALAASASDVSNWDSSVSPHLDGLPFGNAGAGEQSQLKILLALARHGDNADVVLVEEPENHLSFSSLNRLVAKMAEQTSGKQVLVTTHSSFVVNKLGLERLLLIEGDASATFGDLTGGTTEYFKRLSGYDTLRLVLAEKAVLVEGPSDELEFQRAYLDLYHVLPIEHGIDVIDCRGLTFKRFMEIARLLGKRVAVVTDNDGNPDYVGRRYADFADCPSIRVFTGGDPALNTLEPEVVDCNELSLLNKVLDKSCATKAGLVDWMTGSGNKTEWALAVLESAESITHPNYVIEAIKWLAE